MTCPEEAAWLGYLDGEAGPEESARMSEHLEGCTRCQDQVWALQELDAFATEVHRKIPGGITSRRLVHGRWTGRWAVAAGIAGAAALVVGIGPNRVMAELANTFQIQQLQTVSMTQSQMFSVMNQLTQNGRVSLAQYGSVVVSRPSGPADQPLSLDQASQRTGLPVEWPTTLSANNTQVNLGNTMTVVFTPKVQAINQLIRTEGGTQFFPQSLNNVPITLHVPERLRVTSQGPSGAISLTEMRLPSLTVPGSIAVPQVAAAVAALPFWPETVRQSLLAIHDWSSTLVVPISGSVQHLILQGSPAVRSVTKTTQTVIWVHNGVFSLLSHDGAESSEAFMAQVRQWLG